jgi:hypothetical protein
LYQSTSYIIRKLTKNGQNICPVVQVLVCLAIHSQTIKTGTGGPSMFFLLHSVEVVMLLMNIPTTAHMGVLCMQRMITEDEGTTSYATV